MGDKRRTQPKAKQPHQTDLLPRQNDVRALMCFAAAATLLTNINWTSASVAEWAVIAGVLTYTLAGYFWLRRHYFADDRQRLFDYMSTADAVVIGVALSFVSVDLLAVGLFFTMIQFNSLVHGGIKKWLVDNLAFIASVAVTQLAQASEWVLTSSLQNNIIPLIGVFTYFSSYALFLNNQITKLMLLNKKIAHEQTVYKLRTYKLSRYLTPTVWKAVNEGNDKILSAERKRITVFFSDIKGFSSLSEELEAETLTDLLNTYFTEMVKIASKHKGTIDKFMGDGIMIIFGDNHSDGLKGDCLRCLSMAIEMRKKMKELQAQWFNQGIKKPLSIRMGINTGFCTVGSFGTSHYMDYTVLGTHVNLASRLESAAQPGEILVSHETWSLIKDVIICRDKGEINAKGFSHPIKVYQVVDFRKDLGKNQSYFEEVSEGFSMYMDLEKIRNYDKDKIIVNMEKAIERLKDKII
ncbi:adenylate/guanylate cyclase domain-containing protein [Teredinibacter sp. KSP-S5-2]|uniref:adenylate/guanylate cyclase domain-containing protein n=1 Tax=Teredinibacter sp. KSP-S5-2 TaxID=3034506 RepID=UPI0029342BC9|nr:adenylate/guanylate cyclase domain-containing protein [Teredinibacter sp. KSP-S5-2]WNO09957.1 adenylate/guanylate cyclase domain-containing protein [Teredinibacter sp. KSP-S5-2]